MRIQFFGQERQYDADVMLTYGPDADLVKLAAFAERLRQELPSVWAGFVVVSTYKRLNIN